jgi:hypothetical protein
MQTRCTQLAAMNTLIPSSTLLLRDLSRCFLLRGPGLGTRNLGLDAFLPRRAWNQVHHHNQYTPHIPPTCLSQYPTLLMPGCSRMATRSTTTYDPAITVNMQLTTPQQLRRRRWRCYSQHRRLPDDCPDGSDVSRTLWPQQDCHQPPPEDDPDLGCGDDNARTRGCAPRGEVGSHG